MLDFVWGPPHTCSLYGCVNILTSPQILLHTVHITHLPPAIFIASVGAVGASLSAHVVNGAHESLLISFTAPWQKNAKTNT